MKAKQKGGSKRKMAGNNNVRDRLKRLETQMNGFLEGKAAISASLARIEEQNRQFAEILADHTQTLRSFCDPKNGVFAKMAERLDRHEVWIKIFAGTFLAGTTTTLILFRQSIATAFKALLGGS